MKMFDVAENAIDLKKLNVDDFMKIFARVYDSRDLYKKRQAQHLPKVKQLAELNNDILLSLIVK